MIALKQHRSVYSCILCTYLDVQHEGKSRNDTSKDTAPTAARSRKLSSEVLKPSKPRVLRSNNSRSGSNQGPNRLQCPDVGALACLKFIAFVVLGLRVSGF